MFVFIFISIFPTVISQPTSSYSPVPQCSDEDKSPDSSKPKKNRCFICRKRVGLTGKTHSVINGMHLCVQDCEDGTHLRCCIAGFDCRCGNLFCGIHRYSDKHNCTFDYKAEAAAKIRKENPVVVADKIQRI